MIENLSYHVGYKLNGQQIVLIFTHMDNEKLEFRYILQLC